MLTGMTLKDFLEEVASASPAPGGGSVAALAGALGAALVSMVANLSTAPAGAEAAEREQKMRLILDEAAKLMENLGAAVDEDARAFNRVMEAYRMPKQTGREKEERSLAIQQALQAAALHPLKVAGECLKVLHHCREAVASGNPNALSDAGVASLMAYSGLVGALFNVATNLGGIKDTEFKKKVSAEMKGLMDEAAQVLAEVRVLVNSKLSYPVDW
ncbi:cyclodeaminase/cyclohydrolase family protein [Desulfofundulus sp. TPOSR]|uniref:cyclodeaminase/cyclohydrolase family protein n=1 Tax=Desulfofundulus sp. TPOSR TaxID=2714340 RepID=UPI001FADCCBD|nr:cyclodeaminase/cyclohydrolase family protein [Desulfofundulus sp. TPOSR]